MLDKHREVLERCTFCHDQCVFACPVFTQDRRMTVYPSRKAQIARAVQRGELPLNEEVTRLLYQCTSCRLCWQWCAYMEHRKDLASALRAARSEAVASGVCLPEVEAIRNRVENEGTPYGDLKTKRNDLVCGSPREGNVRILLFVDAATLALNPEAYNAFFDLAKACEIAVELTSNNLTGYELADIGLQDLADQIRLETARELAMWLSTPNIMGIVTLNPQIAYALNDWYKEQGTPVDAKVKTLSQFVAELVTAGRLKFTPTIEPAVFQDSAYQARYLEDTESPRLVLREAFSELREAEPCGVEANPASAEGLAPEIKSKVREGMAARRLRELLATGAEVIITADPFSYQALCQCVNGKARVEDFACALAARLKR